MCMCTVMCRFQLSMLSLTIGWYEINGMTIAKYIYFLLLMIYRLIFVFCILKPAKYILGHNPLSSKIQQGNQWV